MSRNNDKIKVAFILWTLEGMGGSERVVYEVASKLDKGLYSVLIVSFKEGPVRMMYERLGFKVCVVSKHKSLDLRFIYNLRKILVDESVNIICPHHFGPFLYSFMAAFGSRAKLVYTEHSQWQLEELYPLYKVLLKIMILKTDAIVSISKQIEDYYVNSLSVQKKKIHSITNGVDLKLYRKSPSDDKRLELGIGAHELIVGMVAHIRPEKNHQLLISAFERVARELKEVRLLLIGNDSLNGAIQRIVGECSVGNRIVFLGQRDDVPELLRIFDVFCLTSVHEGLPLTLLEAMASGVPVIGTDVMGINEIITDNENGLLFPNGDEEKLAEVIMTLLTDEALRIRLSRAGRNFVVENYDIDNMIKRYERLFSTLCAQ